MRNSPSPPAVSAGGRRSQTCQRDRRVPLQELALFFRVPFAAWFRGLPKWTTNLILLGSLTHEQIGVLGNPKVSQVLVSEGSVNVVLMIPEMLGLP